MEQDVIVPAFLYNNNCLNTQAVKKQELPKYQVKQNSTNQIDSLKKELNKKLFAKADSLVHKFLSCTRFSISNLETLILHGVETRVLLSEFAQQLRRENAEVLDIYFRLLDPAGISSPMVLN